MKLQFVAGFFLAALVILSACDSERTGGLPQETAPAVGAETLLPQPSSTQAVVAPATSTAELPYTPEPTFAAEPTIMPVPTNTLEPTAVPQPSSTPGQAADPAQTAVPTDTPAAEPSPTKTSSAAAAVVSLPMTSAELGMLYDLPSDWMVETSGDASCAAGVCPEIFLTKTDPGGAVSSIRFSAVSPQTLTILEGLMNGPAYKEVLIGSLPGRWRFGEAFDEGLIYLAPGKAVQFSSQWRDAVQEMGTVSEIIKSVRSMALASALDGAEPITFLSLWQADQLETMISFEQPRSWQTSYFSSSDWAGWLVSDADPTQAFWDVLRTGNELSLQILPAEDPTTFTDTRIDEVVEEVDEDGRLSAHVMGDGEIHGFVTREGKAFELFGHFPADREAELKDGMEMILTTFNWEEVEDVVVDDEVPLGFRDEGALAVGSSAFGYVPMASISEWQIEGQAGQEVILEAAAFDPNVTFEVDIYGEDGQSLLDEGWESFTGSITLDPVTFPEEGTYYVQVVAPPGYVKLWPINPPAENKIFGWYEIGLTES